MSAAPSSKPPRGRKSPRRAGKRLGRPPKSRDGAVDTRDKILQAATKIFAERGLGGGRINLISRAARSNDRMIYYYFGSKERLFVEVLEKVYRDMWEAESALALDLADPVAALARVVNFTMDHYLSHPEMLTILNNENLHEGKYVSRSKRLKTLSSPALDLMSRICRAGVEKGLFRDDVKPLELYLSILALNYFYISNRHTLSAFLGIDLLGDNLRTWRLWVVDVITRAVRRDGAASAALAPRRPG